MKITLLLAVVAVVVVDDAQSQECDLIDQFNNGFAKLIRTLVSDTDLQDAYVGCVKPFVLGDSSECDPKKFKLPQAKICEKVIQHAEFKKQVKNHNILGFRNIIENIIYADGGEVDEFCKNMPTEVDKLLPKLTKEAELEKTEELLDKVCKKNPNRCIDKVLASQEAQDFFFEDVSPSFKDFIKNIIAQFKENGNLNVTGKLELMFGGGDFGIKVTKCLNKILTISTSS